MGWGAWGYCLHRGDFVMPHANGAGSTALHAIGAAILRGADRILPANELDLANARDNGMSEGMQDRLRLDYRRLEALEAAVLPNVDRVKEACRELLEY